MILFKKKRKIKNLDEFIEKIKEERCNLITGSVLLEKTDKTLHITGETGVGHIGNWNYITILKGYSEFRKKPIIFEFEIDKRVGSEYGFADNVERDKIAKKTLLKTYNILLKIKKKNKLEIRLLTPNGKPFPDHLIKKLTA